MEGNIQSNRPPRAASLEVAVFDSVLFATQSGMVRRDDSRSVKIIT